MSELINIQDEVMEILRRFPLSRNSDLLLIWIYFNNNLKLDMPTLTWEQYREYEGRMESVRRARQRIQNTLLMYPPTNKAVMDKRRQKEEDYREWFSRRRGTDA